MNIAAKHIVHLMSSEGSLSLSGLGTFERIEIPAIYNSDLHTILPARISIRFDSDPTVTTSEVLVNSLMRSDCCDKTSAMQILEDCGKAISEEMKTIGNYRFDGLGILMNNVGESSVMQLSEDFVDNKAQRWLSEIDLSPLATQEPKTLLSKDDADAAMHSLSWRRVARAASTWAAAVVVFGIVAVVTVFANRFADNSGVNMASPLANISHGVPEMEIKERPSTPLVLIFRTPADAVDVARVRSTHSFIAGNTDSYCLVVASLANEAEALAFIAQNSTAAIPLYLLQSKGYHRVYAMSGSSPETVLQKAANMGVTDIYQNMWVCHR